MIDYELPNTWQVGKLGSVCFTTSGGTPSRKRDDFYGGSIPWVKSGELSKGLIIKTEEYITEQAVKNSSAKIFPAGTLLIALYGATIGKLGFLGVDAATNQAVCGIFKNDVVDLRYLYNFLYHNKGKLIEQGAGGAQPNISQTILKDLDIVIPPLPEQHRIVAKIEELFSELDKGIETLKTAQQQLKVYRQAVLKYAFEGKLTNPDVKEGELPEGWMVKKLGDIVIKSTQKAYPDKSSDAIFLGMDSIEPHSTKPHVFYNFSEMKSAGNLFNENQVLYGRMRPYLNKVWVADRLGVASGEFIVLSCKTCIEPFYLQNILHHQDFVNFANSKTSGDRPRISFDEIAEFEILLPELNEQAVILSEIQSRLSVCDKIEETIEHGLQQAEALRQSILKKAFEGKLVPQDPNDEPASVLLERIKAERTAVQPDKMVRAKKTIRS